MPRRSPSPLRAVACAAVLGSSLFGLSVVHAAPGWTLLPGAVPPWAQPANLAGAADPTEVVGFRVYLGWTDPDGAVALAKAVSDPHSPSYGKYLTSNQFRARFAPSASDTAKVQNWLRSQGFDVQYTPKNNHYVSAQGTVAQLQAAFNTQFAMYDVRGATVRAPSTDVSVPSQLAAIVRGVYGLDDSAYFIHPYARVDKDAPPSEGFRNAPPLSNYWAELVSPYAYPAGFTAVANPPTVPWTVKGYTPDQIKGAYGISGYDGAGQTVAVIDAYASSTILQDVNQWSSNHGLPQMKPSQLVQVTPPGVYRRPENRKQDPQGWYGEETLDIEAVHGMAPAAKIVFIGAPNNYRDLDAALNHVVDERLADIVTNSYGFSTELLPGGYINPVEDTLVQAAIEGIGVYFSSGDNGDETSTVGYATPDWPASSPWVTAVGGTSLGIGATNLRVLETGWGTSNYNCDATTLACTRTGWLYGAGGGVSRIFAQPDYQKSVGVLGGRGVPDVAALADPQTGMLVGQTQTFPDGAYYDEYRLGGTSLASPIFAGLMALANQAAGKSLGFANPLFYARPGSLYDVTSVKTAVARRNYVNNVDASAGTVDRLRTFDDYSGSPTQHTSSGWDNVTGLGTPTSALLSIGK